MNEQQQGQRILISGAGFAGLVTAIFMRRSGYQVTVVENAPGLRKGGTPLDLRSDVMAIADRLGIRAGIEAKTLAPRAMEFRDVDGARIVRIEPDQAEPGRDADKQEIHRRDDVEIHREDLIAILFAALDDGVEVVFDDSITGLTDTDGGVRASFRNRADEEFALVLGCDGSHSAVRRLRFGPESEYSRFLHNYSSITIVDGAVIEPWTTLIQNVPDRTLMLNSYGDSTDIVLSFHADEEIPYDHHDVDQQKEIVRRAFADAGEPFASLLEAALTADNFYFTPIGQIEVPAWSSGRVALVGDAGYFPSPASGMGGSLAILGATALHDAFTTADGDIDAALAEYERSFRPVAERVQDEARRFGVPMVFPQTADEIAARNAQLADHQ